MNAIEAIANFFGIPIESVESLPNYQEMELAVMKDDYMQLHHLGYSITLNKRKEIELCQF